MRKIVKFLVLPVFLVFMLAACAPSAPQQQDDKVNSDLNTAKDQITDLQGKLAQAQTQIDGLNKQNSTQKTQSDTLQAKYDQLSKQYDTSKSDYTTLQANYDALNKQYNALLEKTTNVPVIPVIPVIKEPDVEQAIFKLVNQDRVSRGAPELQWGVNIYGWATQNSQAMAKDGKVEYSSYLTYQDEYWTTGYDSADKMAAAAVAVWKATARYEVNFLNPGMRYGTAGVYKSGDIYYITWAADFFR